MMRQLHKLRDLVGYSLHARDGEIGKLEEIYFDDRRWVARYFVVHTGSWLVGRKVLIVPAVIMGLNEEERSFSVELTRDQVENSPPVDTQRPISRHYEMEYYRYYGWDPYWGADPLFGPATYVPPPAGEAPREPPHPHLRSSDEVRGYRIHARDGEIGHVEDFVLEEPGWTVRYLEVDTRNWLPGKHVLIAPTWVQQVEWAAREVTVEQTREATKTAPAYHPADLISRDYQVQLYKHYGMRFDDT